MSYVPYENSFCINYELSENDKSFATLTIKEGGITRTEKTSGRLGECDIFGHSHGHGFPSPSRGDLLSMDICKPEFIVGKRDIYFYNIEDKQKYKEFSKLKYGNYFQRKPLIRLGGSSNLIREEARKEFFKDSGIRIYPYKKDMLIEFKVI